MKIKVLLTAHLSSRLGFNLNYTKKEPLCIATTVLPKFFVSLIWKEKTLQCFTWLHTMFCHCKGFVVSHGICFMEGFWRMWWQSRITSTIKRNCWKDTESCRRVNLNFLDTHCLILSFSLMTSHSHAVVSEYFPEVHLIFLLIFVPQNDTSKTFWEPELAKAFDYIKMHLKVHRSNFVLTFAIAKLELFCWNQ